MKIHAMTFSQSEEGAIPATITVSISLAEAVWIGKTAGNTAGNAVASEIYGALTGDVFNRFWEEGIDEAARTAPAPSGDQQ